LLGATWAYPHATKKKKGRIGGRGRGENKKLNTKERSVRLTLLNGMVGRSFPLTNRGGVHCNLALKECQLNESRKRDEKEKL